MRMVERNNSTLRKKRERRYCLTKKTRTRKATSKFKSNGITTSKYKYQTKTRAKNLTTTSTPMKPKMSRYLTTPRRNRQRNSRTKRRR